MRKLSFKEYYNSKEQLLLASNNLPRIISEYVVKKYCKVPLLDSNNDKEYVSLKPKDTVKVLWEFEDIKNPKVKSITINDTKYSPCWDNDKVRRWIDQTTLEKGK